MLARTEPKPADVPPEDSEAVRARLDAQARSCFALLKVACRAINEGGAEDPLRRALNEQTGSDAERALAPDMNHVLELARGVVITSAALAVAIDKMNGADEFRRQRRQNAAQRERNPR